MSITIQIPTDIEKYLLEYTNQKGLPVDDWVSNLVKEKLEEERILSEDELLQKINLGLPEETWKRYHFLTEKRDNYTLTEEEYVEINAISDEMEEINADRITNLVKLAKLKNTSLDAIMAELQIKKPSYD